MTVTIEVRDDELEVGMRVVATTEAMQRHGSLIGLEIARALDVFGQQRTCDREGHVPFRGAIPADWSWFCPRCNTHGERE